MQESQCSGPSPKQRRAQDEWQTEGILLTAVGVVAVPCSVVLRPVILTWPEDDL